LPNNKRPGRYRRADAVQHQAVAALDAAQVWQLGNRERCLGHGLGRLGLQRTAGAGNQQLAGAGAEQAGD
jgi:hypothetical protein